MEKILTILESDVLDPKAPLGVAFWGGVYMVVSLILIGFLRRVGIRIESHFMDVTGLRFAISLAQVFIFLLGFVLYAHFIPALHSLGTAVLAGVSITSLVLELSAQSTLSNLFAGLSLVLYRPVRVGDTVRLNTPTGLTTAIIEAVSLGYTQLRDTDGAEIIVPNSVMMSSVIIRVNHKNA